MASAEGEAVELSTPVKVHPLVVSTFSHVCNVPGKRTGASYSSTADLTNWELVYICNQGMTQPAVVALFWHPLKIRNIYAGRCLSCQSCSCKPAGSCNSVSPLNCSRAQEHSALHQACTDAVGYHHVLHLQVTDTVEAWLDQLTNCMRATLHHCLTKVEGMSDPFSEAPAQVLGLYHALLFTQRCEACCLRR